jgi:hypothetical protein
VEISVVLSKIGDFFKLLKNWSFLKIPCLKILSSSKLTNNKSFLKKRHLFSSKKLVFFNLR